MGSFDKLEAVLFDLRGSAVADVAGFDESLLYACDSRYTYKTTRRSVGHLTLGSQCAAQPTLTLLNSMKIGKSGHATVDE